MKRNLLGARGDDLVEDDLEEEEEDNTLDSMVINNLKAACKNSFLTW